MKVKSVKQIVVAFVLAGVVMAGTPVMAHNGEDHSRQYARPTVELRTQTTDDEAQKETRRAEIKDRLTDARLRACQAREKAMKTIMTRAVERGERQITRFNTIAERVQAFYVKQGKMLANYDQLVADVAAKKAAAQTAIQATKSSGTNFNCSADNPKEMIQTFKAQLKTQGGAIQAFRTSVRNLIVGVKSVQGATMSERAGER